MIDKLKNFLFRIRNQFLREKLFILLLNARGFFIRNVRVILRYIHPKREAPSTKYFSSTNLEEEYRIHYKDINKSVEIDPHYFLQISFFNFLLQNYNFHSCVEIGSYGGELLDTLSKNNPDISFTGYDINPTIKKINNIYSNKNLRFLFQENEILDFSKFNIQNTLLISKAVFMYYTEEKLTEIFKRAKEANLDIALAEPTRYQYNHHSRELDRSLEHGHVAYSHNYALLLNKIGYNIVYDSNMINLGYHFTKEYKPYFLSLVYASLRHNNKKMNPLGINLRSLNKYLTP